MVKCDPDTGDADPTFTATGGTSDDESFDLDDYLSDGSSMLAYFPGTFTPPCINDMVALQEPKTDPEGRTNTMQGWCWPP